MTTGLRALVFVGVAAAVCLPIYRSGARLRPLEPVARAQATATAAVLAWVGAEVRREGSVLRHPGGFAIEIHPNCTAWVHFALFVVGLTALPLDPRQRWSAAAAGGAVLLVANVARLAGLFAVGVAAAPHFDLAHRVLGEAFLAGCVLLLWLVPDKVPVLRS